MAAVFARRALLPTVRCLARASKKAPNVSQARFITSSKSLEARWFSKDHEWLEVKGEKGTVGISDYAQEKLGEIVFVETPEVGATIEFEEIVGCLESVKAASDIISPVNGQVTEVNSELKERPDLVNSSPMEEGWLFKVDISGAPKTDDLMDEKAYLEFIQTDSH